MDNRPIGVFDSSARHPTAVKETFGDYATGTHRLFLAILGVCPRFPGQRDDSKICRPRHPLSDGKPCQNDCCCVRHRPSLARNLKSPQGVPFIDVHHPTALAASAATRNKRVGVIGTSATIRSGSYRRALCRSIREIQVYRPRVPYLFLW